MFTFGKKSNIIMNKDIIHPEGAVELLEYIKKREALNRSKLARLAGIGTSVLYDAIAGTKSLPERHVDNLQHVLEQYGFEPHYETLIKV